METCQHALCDSMALSETQEWEQDTVTKQGSPQGQVSPKDGTFPEGELSSGLGPLSEAESGLTCSLGPQNGVLGPVEKAGRNLYMAGVGGLVLCTDRALSGKRRGTTVMLGARSRESHKAQCMSLSSSALHLTSTARSWGLQVSSKGASLYLGGQWRSKVQRFLIQLV